MGGHKEFLNMDPMDLLNFLEDSFTYEIPVGIDSEMAMRKAGNMLGTLTNAYSYLASLGAFFTVYTKAAKAKMPSKPKTKEADLICIYEKAKTEYETMNLRKFLVDQYAEIIKQEYTSVSRMITVKIEADRELRMSESRGVA